MWSGLLSGIEKFAEETLRSLGRAARTFGLLVGLPFTLRRLSKAAFVDAAAFAPRTSLFACVFILALVATRVWPMINLFDRIVPQSVPLAFDGMLLWAAPALLYGLSATSLAVRRAVPPALREPCRDLLLYCLAGAAAVLSAVSILFPLWAVGVVWVVDRLAGPGGYKASVEAITIVLIALPLVYALIAPIVAYVKVLILLRTEPRRWSSRGWSIGAGLLAVPLAQALSVWPVVYDGLAYGYESPLHFSLFPPTKPLSEWKGEAILPVAVRNVSGEAALVDLDTFRLDVPDLSASPVGAAGPTVIPAGGTLIVRLRLHDPIAKLSRDPKAAATRTLLRLAEQPVRLQLVARLSPTQAPRRQEGGVGCGRGDANDAPFKSVRLSSQSFFLSDPLRETWKSKGLWGQEPLDPKDGPLRPWIEENLLGKHPEPKRETSS